MASGESPDPAQNEIDGSSTSQAESGDVTERLPAVSEVAEVSFPVSVRGYERGAVDAYVSQVQHLVAELESTRSPEAAVKQALEQVGEQTKGILEQAGATAERITVAARREADDKNARAKQEAESVVAAAKAEATDILTRSRTDAETRLAQARTKAAEHLQSARAEAAAVREEAEARLRELQADTDTVRGERTDLLDDLRELATRVKEVAGEADERLPPSKAAERSDEEGTPAETANVEAGAEEAEAKAAAEAADQRRSST